MILLIKVLSSFKHLFMNMIYCERFLTFSDSKVGQLISHNESMRFSLSNMN